MEVTLLLYWTRLSVFLCQYILLQKLRSLLVLQLPERARLYLPYPLPAHAHELPDLLQRLHPAILEPKPPRHHLLFSRVQAVEDLRQVLSHELLNQQLLRCFCFGVCNHFLDKDERKNITIRRRKKARL